VEGLLHVNPGKDLEDGEKNFVFLDNNEESNDTDSSKNSDQNDIPSSSTKVEYELDNGDQEVPESSVRFPFSPKPNTHSTMATKKEIEELIHYLRIKVTPAFGVSTYKDINPMLTEHFFIQFTQIYPRKSLRLVRNRINFTLIDSTL